MKVCPRCQEALNVFAGLHAAVKGLDMTEGEREDAHKQLDAHEGHFKRVLGHILRDVHQSRSFKHFRSTPTKTHAYGLLDYKKKVHAWVCCAVACGVLQCCVPLPVGGG
jgi:hypothetical protein